MAAVLPSVIGERSSTESENIFAFDLCTLMGHDDGGSLHSISRERSRASQSDRDCTLLTIEATAVLPEARISARDFGLWSDETEAARGLGHRRDHRVCESA